MALERLYKFGKTTSNDILQRFDLDTHMKLEWRNTPLALNYNITPLWSMWVPKEKALEAEKWFEKNYPKTFYSATTYNGISECRNWSMRESYAFQELLEKKYPKNSRYWQRIQELKLNNTLFSTHDKIYYIMLTKR